ncbi:hypothetical protein D3C76_691760 [compost metagenome]
MVVDDALGIARGAGCVIERDGLPFIFRPLPGELRVTSSEEGFIVQHTDRAAFAVFRVVHIDHQWRMGEQAQGLTNDRVELAVSDQYLGFAVLKHEGNGLRVQAYVQGVEHRANHRHAKVNFKHGRDVGQHHRHCVALADTPLAQGAGQAPAALIGLLPVAPDRAVDHGRILTVDRGRALDEAQWREGDVVDCRGRQACFENRHEVFLWGDHQPVLLCWKPPMADC